MRKLYLFLIFIFLISIKPATAVSTTPTQSPTPTKKIASPSATLTPTAGPDDEKVKEIREAIKEKVNEIKEKIEKKAYVGTIEQITDATLTLDNFRGKQRIRLTEETTIIGSNKKEIKAKDIAVEDKVIAMGNLSDNDILEAKRVVVVPKPTSQPTKRLTASGTISKIDSQNSQLTLSPALVMKVETKTVYVNVKDAKITLKFKDLKEGQKVIIVYPEPASGKTPVAKTIFVLP